MSGESIHMAMPRRETSTTGASPVVARWSSPAAIPPAMAMPPARSPKPGRPPMGNSASPGFSALPTAPRPQNEAPS